MTDIGSPEIGPFLRTQRQQQGLTLDDLAKKSGVSKSMLSMIERGQTNPTLATVWALAQALNVELSEMIGVQSPSRQVRIDVASPAFTPEIRNDDGLCVLRILSPADRVDSLEWYELRFEPQGALVSAAHGRGTREHLTVLEGELRVQAGDETSLVTTGATARYPADVSHEIRNTGDRPARAILVVVA